jgi:rod shape-determining protein MreD
MSSTSRAFAVLIVSYALMGLESPLLQELELSFFAPDLALISVVWVAFNMNSVSGALTCFVLGAMKDGFVMGAPIGMHMEIFVVEFYLLRLVSGRIPIRGLLTSMLATGMAELLAVLLFGFLSVIFDPTFQHYSMLWRLMVPVALVTAPFAPLVFYLLDRVDRVFRQSGRDSLFA